MNERIDHATEARVYIEAADARPSAEWLPQTGESKSDWIAVAQVHATLALAEQQRIANLIALHRHEVKYDIGSWSRLYDEGEELRPEIKKALGIE